MGSGEEWLQLGPLLLESAVEELLSYDSNWCDAHAVTGLGFVCHSRNGEVSFLELNPFSVKPQA